MELSRSLKYFLLGFLVTAIAIVSVSCGDKDKKKSAVSARVRPGVTQTGPTAGCPSCSTSNLIATALGESLPGGQDQFQLGLDFFYVNGSNQISAAGVLFINNVSPFGQCFFTPGGYEIRAVGDQFGQQLQSGAISGIGLEAVSGAHVIKLRINYVSLDGITQASSLDCNGDNYESSMLGSVIVESVNGYPCGGNGFNKTFELVGVAKNGFQCNGY